MGNIQIQNQRQTYGDNETDIKQIGQHRTSQKPISLPRLIDSIASMYILKQSFQDLKKLTEPKYCNDLVILTSDVINERLNWVEVEYLGQRIKKGIKTNNIEKENVIYFNKNELDKLDIQNNVKKRRLCVSIARFYIKIAHLFSAIIMTINPIYTYKNAYGNKERVSYKNKLNIPKEINALRNDNFGLCARRIKSTMIDEVLKDKEHGGEGDGEKKNKYEIKNKICDMNKDKKSLLDEPGIPELYQLYFDKFDFNKKQFTMMSEESRKQYDIDLKTFYTAFTGKTTMPKYIKRFSDIKLKDYHNKKICNPQKGILRNKYKTDNKDSFIRNYAEKINIMKTHIHRQNNKLIEILDDIFVYKIEPQTKNKEITLHPRLTMDKLELLVKKARGIIVELYSGCENDFMNTLRAFETVIENQIKKNTEQKIKNIKRSQEELLAEI